MKGKPHLEDPDALATVPLDHQFNWDVQRVAPFIFPNPDELSCFVLHQTTLKQISS